MSIKASSAVWADPSITNQADLLVLLAIADYANDHFIAWPSIEAIASKARLFPRSVFRILDRLKRAGKLRIDSGGGRHQKNRYTIMLNPVPETGVNGVPGTGNGHETLSLSAQNPVFGVPPKTPDPSGTVREPSKRKKKPAPLALSSVLDRWNAKAASETPKCLLLSDKRKRSLQSRLQEPFFASNWEAAIDRIAASNFCRGKNERGWKASFDWFLKPDTVPKIMEGKYDNAAPTNGVPEMPLWQRVKACEKLLGDTISELKSVRFPNPLSYESPNGEKYKSDLAAAQHKHAKLKAEKEELCKKLADLNRQAAYSI